LLNRKGQAVAHSISITASGDAAALKSASLGPADHVVATRAQAEIYGREVACRHVRARLCAVSRLAP
jgi:hypothetical protein